MLLAQSRALHRLAAWTDGWMDGQMAFLLPVLSPTAILVRALLLTQAAAAAGNISPFTTMLSLMIFDRHVKKKKCLFTCSGCLKIVKGK